MKKGFSLVELLIVIAVIGIVAAIVVPQFQDHTVRAKESAAKADLRILRTAIELYAARHGVPPGYPGNDPSLSPSNHPFTIQMITEGKYLSKMPANPFSGQSVIKLVDNSEAFPEEPLLTNLYGWIYKPATKTIKLNWTGTDSAGTPYFSY
ncbi:MAG TPA: prepilin-type N-terminal cleavage/methylation domain-containing protein [Sedimentisphaerales bacterium]|nr:prepilin-type N-terminal cleavage/methylation domain-containing protein [Sedimentisphaerales bacterium]